MAADWSVIAQALLDTVLAAIPEARRPGRVFRSHGAPAWELVDADQLTVHISPVEHQQRGNPRAQQVVSVVTFTVQLARCVPGLGTSTAPEDLDESARLLADDMAAINRAVIQQAATVFGRHAPIVFGSAVPLGPSGNMAGWSWPVTYTVS